MSARLPDGFGVRLRGEVAWHALGGGEVLLVGGSPTIAMRLGAAAAGLIEDGSLTVAGAASARLARRLLDGNLADPVPGAPVAADGLTVVIPIRDRADRLERCLAALAGLAVVVVDDASRDAASVAAVAGQHGARLIALPVNAGPAAARNAGLAVVRTPLVAFVDSDVTATAEMLRGLAGQFADPLLAVAGPLVRGVVRSARPRWFETYDAAASSLALGVRTCSVRPGAAVGWLPSACLVARVAALREVGGFSAELRVGEDVDLVWRLLDAGWRVRYDPGFVAAHDVRRTVRGWLGRKVLYGSGGAGLAARHDSAVAVARLSPLMAVAGAGILLRRPWSVAAGLAAAGVTAYRLANRLPPMPGRGRAAAALGAVGLWWAVRQEAALLLRHWWPATVAGCLLSGSVRRAVGTALVVDAIVAATVDRPLGDSEVGPVRGWFGRRLDDLAYGAGLWLGAAKARSARCLAVKFTRG